MWSISSLLTNLSPPPPSESCASLSPSLPSSSPRSSGTSSASLSSSVSLSLASIHFSGGSTTSSPSSLRISSESSCSAGSSGLSSKSSLAMPPMLPDAWRFHTSRSTLTARACAPLRPSPRCPQRHDRTQATADSEVLCAITLADRDQRSVPGRMVRWLLLQPWPPLWHSRFPYISLTPPAGGPGVGAEERRRPIWRSRLPASPSYVIFAGVSGGPRLSPYAAQHGAADRSWPPAVGRRLDRRRICCTCRQRSKRTSGRRIVRPAQCHEGQLLLALHRHARIPQRAGRGVGQPPRPQPQTVREHAGRRSSGTPDSDDADAGRPAALGARTGDAAMGAHRLRHPGQRRAQRPAGAARRPAGLRRLRIRARGCCIALAGGVRGRRRANAVGGPGPGSSLRTAGPLPGLHAAAVAGQALAVGSNPVFLSRYCSRSWAATSMSLCRHSDARYTQAIKPVR